MTILAIIGLLVATIFALYVVVALFQLAFFCFIGFDEVNIPVGLVCCFLAGAVTIGWWFLVGTHVHVSFS